MKNYKLQTKTIWRFKDRGSWETHKGDYPGNWSPHVPRNLLMRYSRENDYILDPFVGSGTTLIEAKILNRNSIGIDVNKHALEISNSRINFNSKNNSKHYLYLGDSRNMKMIKDKSIDFICTHPPYHNIIKYSYELKNDISLLNYDEFLQSINDFSLECKRVLKTNKFIAFMIADTRKKGNIIPLGFNTLEIFLNNGFILKDIIIKEQFNCSKTKYWEDILTKRNMHLINHEYIFILQNK